MSTIAYLGPEASYTHQAALSAFPDDGANALTPCPTIADVFAAVQSRTSRRGVVPVENSSNGAVIATLDLFADVAARCPDILVCGEVYVPVKHCLLGRRQRRSPSSPPLPSRTSPSLASRGSAAAPEPPHELKHDDHDVDLGHIKHLYSHPQAWGQCKAFLAARLKGVEQHDASSTSRAAALAASDSSGASAAVASALAAAVHGLDVLARRIEDADDNATRFLILRRRGARDENDDGAEGGGGETAREEGGREADKDAKQFKVLVAFTVSHEDPGALAKALGVFGAYRLNLTSINARPGASPWNYIFFVELKGRGQDERAAVHAALGDLGREVTWWRWFGIWESGM